MKEMEIIIQPDGGILVERGDKNQNKIILGLFDGHLDDNESLRQFTSITDNAKLIFGDTTLCG